MCSFVVGLSTASVSLLPECNNCGCLYSPPVFFLCRSFPACLLSMWTKEQQKRHSNPKWFAFLFSLFRECSRSINFLLIGISFLNAHTDSIGMSYAQTEARTVDQEAYDACSRSPVFSFRLFFSASFPHRQDVGIRVTEQKGTGNIVRRGGHAFLSRESRKDKGHDTTG